MRHLWVLVALFCAGCASYRTPGAAIALTQIERADAVEVAQQPAPQFPLKLGVVRVQAATYKSFSSASRHPGRFGVIDPQELLHETQLQDISLWPAVAGVAPLDPVLLPDRLDTLEDLRLAAAKMQADVLLIYTVETSFQTAEQKFAPLSKLALGKPPAAGAAIAVSVSASFIDVRTGFVYGSAQAARSAPVSGGWGTAQAVETRRLDVEQQAFAALLEAAAKIWDGIVSRYQ